MTLFVANAQHVSHTIQRGETLESIAEKYQITVQALKQANPEASEFFYVGMKLIIPAKSAVASQPTAEIPKESKVVAASEEKRASQSLSKGNSDDDWVTGAGYHVFFDPDAKNYGLQISQDPVKFVHIAFGISHTFVDHGATGAYLGLGVGAKYLYDPIMVFANVYPYASLSLIEEITNWEDVFEYNKKPTYKSKTKFSYGAQAELGIGLKVYESGNGKKFLVSGGYCIGAPEFKTDNMFKNGVWFAGITVVGI